LQTFASDRALGREFHLQALITVVDCVNGRGNIERMPEAQKQVALADRIILTKPDLADPTAVQRLTAQIAALSAAPLVTAEYGAIAPEFVFNEPPAARHRFELGDAAHSHGLDSFSLIFDQPMRWAAFEQAMAVLTALRGPDLLRVKGILAISECRGPVVVHAVQHLAHPPVELENWPDADHRSRLVFVTRGLSRASVAALFGAVRDVAVAREQAHYDS
jgi:G3E family GTPase